MGTVFGATLAAVIIFAAAAYVVHRLLIPRLSRRRNARLSVMEEAKEIHKDGDDNSSFSSSLHVHAGEKQLLALCRALIKNSRIIVLVRARRSCGV